MFGDRSFGGWLRQRRRALDLTQAELARRVGCSTVTLRKLEAETRKPSRQIAERLAEVLRAAPEDRAAFLRFARGDAFAQPPDDRPPAPSHSSLPPRHNLPLQLTRFIGREAEVAALRQIGLGRSNPPQRTDHPGDRRALPSAAEVRLVTLTGAGGSGKTRLALEAAHTWLEAGAFADGVWLVELAPLLDPALVPQAVASVLGLKEAHGRPVTDVLVHHLRARQILLMLDNCEHLIQACAELAQTLLSACGRLCVLATSREALNIPGEHVFLVPTLATPAASDAAPRDPASLDALARYDSVQFFVDRAQAARPGFRLTHANAAAVIQVCRQLDGIPLAIELAAARVRVLRVAEIAVRLDDRFQLLRGGSRTDLPRHQTLQALIDWSHALLTEPEQVLLRRLAVFAGGWTMEAARAVCAGEGVAADAVLDLLDRLVSKSLVSAERPGAAGTRYAMLETIRQYALAKLEASAEATVARRKHALYFYGLAEAWNPILVTKDRASALAQFDAERDNFRAVLPWIWSEADPAFASRFAILLGRYLFDRGYWSESRTLHLAGLALTDTPEMRHTEARVHLLEGLGSIYQFESNYVDGERFLAQGLALANDLGMRWASANILYHLGRARREHGDAIAARQQLEESLAGFKALGDTPWVNMVLNALAGVAILEEDAARAAALIDAALAINPEEDIGISLAWSLYQAGHIAQLRGDYAQATQMHTDSLDRFQQLNLQLGRALAMLGLGQTALGQHDARRSTAFLHDALKLLIDLGDRVGIAWCLAGLAGAAVLDEAPLRAARLWGAAEALRQSIGCRPAPAGRATREQLMAAARAQLGDSAFDAAWAAGQTLTLEQAVALALNAAA